MIFFVDFLSFLDIFMLLISSNIDYTLYFGRIFSCKGNYFDFYSIENIFLVLTFFASSICCLKNRLAISLHFNSSQYYDNFNIFPTLYFTSFNFINVINIRFVYLRNILTMNFISNIYELLINTRNTIRVLFLLVLFLKIAEILNYWYFENTILSRIFNCHDYSRCLATCFH